MSEKRVRPLPAGGQARQTGVITGADTWLVEWAARVLDRVDAERAAAAESERRKAS